VIHNHMRCFGVRFTGSHCEFEHRHEINVPPKESDEPLRIELTGDKIAELQYLLERAMGCLDPHKTPEWANELSSALETR
jgi:hypothetical protein